MNLDQTRGVGSAIQRLILSGLFLNFSCKFNILLDVGYRGILLNPAILQMVIFNPMRDKSVLLRLLGNEVVRERQASAKCRFNR